MRYGSLGGGKRLRPFLVAESAALFGVPEARALMAGAALECIHCYSLVHDDLPAMDNDDLRRGRPTVHKAFDDATAVLAGDGLLTIAFDILAQPETHPDARVRIALVSALARAAGIGGMAGGQMLDLQAEGRFGGSSKPLGAEEVAVLQAMKTGALLRFACRGRRHPRRSGGRPSARLCRAMAPRSARRFRSPTISSTSKAIPKVVGKATGKDASANKATLVAVLGPVQARKRRLAELVAAAEASLAPFGDTGGDPQGRGPLHRRAAGVISPARR